MADRAIIREDPMEGFVLPGFKGMRRHAINQFAKKFFITEDNPNGTIEPFPEDMEKDKLDSLMNLYMGQGKFGDDPFDVRPKDEVADLRKELEELKAMFKGPRANPANEPYKPPTKSPDPMTVDRPCPPEDMALEDLTWKDVRTKAKSLGLKPFHKTRAVVISEIEAKEAE